MDFDRLTERAGTHQLKWSGAEQYIGLKGPDALPMWVADMDFDVAPVIAKAAERIATSGIMGYFSGDAELSEAVADWMRTRHGWFPDPAHIRHTYGLGNAIGLCLKVFCEPGDQVIIFTPVYMEFAAKIKKGQCVVKESPLRIGPDGRFEMDLDALEASMTGREKVMLISSPHNPAGRIWTVAEQKALAAFCARQDLILLSDEIHHDLVFAGERHVPMAIAAPEATERLVMLTAASKTFNIAGNRLGSVTIEDDALRARFDALINALDIKPNLFGVVTTRAAYSREGATWVDALNPYLAENARVFAQGISDIPGLTSMPMQSTYLAWVDFAPLGMPYEEVQRRIVEDARIGPSPGPAFGTGGECAMRFNLGTQRARVEHALARLQEAFADIQ